MPSRRALVLCSIRCGKSRSGRCGYVEGNPSSYAVAIAKCPAGKKALGGGLDTTGLVSLTIEASYPDADDEWKVYAFNIGGLGYVRAFAVCATVA